MMTDIYWMSASPSYEAEKNRAMYHCNRLTMAEKMAARRTLAKRSARSANMLATATKSLFAALLTGVTRS